MDAKEIGQKIRTARRGKNLTQSQLAEILGYSTQSVLAWEKGRSVPLLLVFEKIKEVLEMRK